MKGVIMDTQVDFKDMTDEQLVEMNQELGRQQDDIRARRVAIADELRRRAAAKVLAQAGVQSAVVRGQTLEAKTEV
jgi:hypothetical protein